MRRGQETRKISTFSEPLCAFLWAGGILLLTVLDQWTKHLAEAALKGSEGICLIPGVL